MRRRVVHPRNLRGTGDLYGLAGFVGLLAFLPGAVAVVFGIALSAFSVVLVLATLVASQRVELTGYRKAAVFGLSFGIGLSTVPAIMTILWVAPGSPLLVTSLVLLTVILAPAVTAVLGLTLWRLTGLLWKPPLLQDGTLCPGCAYSLVGNESLVCPECGRPYTPEEICVDPPRTQAERRA